VGGFCLAVVTVDFVLFVNRWQGGGQSRRLVLLPKEPLPRVVVLRTLVVVSVGFITGVEDKLCDGLTFWNCESVGRCVVHDDFNFSAKVGSIVPTGDTIFFEDRQLLGHIWQSMCGGISRAICVGTLEISHGGMLIVVGAKMSYPVARVVPREGTVAWAVRSLTDIESRVGDARGEWSWDHATGRVDCLPGVAAISNRFSAFTVNENVGKETLIA